MFEVDRSVVGTGLSRIGSALVAVAVAIGGVIRRHPWETLGLALGSGATAAICINALFLQASPHPAPMLAGKPRPVAAGDATGSFTSVQPRPRPAIRAETTAADASASARPRAQIVADIQRELSRRGLFDGPVDGIYGAKTDAAIRDFEHAVGVRPSAQPDEALLRVIARAPLAMKSAAAPAAGAVTSGSATPAASGAPAASSTSARPLGAASGKSASKPAPHAPVPPAPIPSSKRVLAVQRALADFGYGQVRPTGVLGAETKVAIERFERERKLPVTGQISDRLTRELAAVTGRPLD
jgi:peptidoglycan hydrolase-like protein with peptidoglycan-binding domain